MTTYLNNALQVTVNSDGATTAKGVVGMNRKKKKFKLEREMVGSVRHKRNIKDMQ
jgi:hypothetical protein